MEGLSPFTVSKTEGEATTEQKSLTAHKTNNYLVAGYNYKG